jgi:hypothetical protein
MDRTEQRMKKKNKVDWVEVEDVHSLTRWVDLPRPMRLRIMQTISKRAKNLRRRAREAVHLQVGCAHSPPHPPLLLPFRTSSYFPLPPPIPPSNVTLPPPTPHHTTSKSRRWNDTTGTGGFT